ncbi:hypothetical protein DFH09DRAFT_632585 [Mycena vulgaris]|nr:hypothetical protein DFH09DRAFT_632585 [Mycena vulgaris]
MGSPHTRLARCTARRKPSRAGRGQGCRGAQPVLWDEARGAGRVRAAAAACASIPARRRRMRIQPLDLRRLLAPTHEREREAGGDAAVYGTSWCWVYWEVGVGAVRRTARVGRRALWAMYRYPQIIRQSSDSTIHLDQRYMHQILCSITMVYHSTMS